MTKARVKLLIFVIAVASFVPLGIIGFRAMSDFLSEFQRGANPASIFHGYSLVVPESDQARWLVDGLDTGTVPSRVQRDEIIASYVEAWGALNHALESGNVDDLPTYWAGAPLNQARTAVDTDDPIEQTDSHHRLRLQFFSDDGSIVAFDDLSFILTQTRDSQITELLVTAHVVMTLDNGFWRIRLLNINY